MGGSATELDNTRWTFTSIDGARPISGRSELSIADGHITATAGCNTLNSTLKASSGKLITGAFATTMMQCDGLMAQEDAVSGLLGSHPAYTVKGDTLTLQGGGHSAALKRLP